MDNEDTLRRKNQKVADSGNAAAQSSLSQAMQEPRVRRATLQERHAEKLRLEQKYRTVEPTQKPSDQGQTGDVSLDLEK